jgi:hypothetical protein
MGVQYALTENPVSGYQPEKFAFPCCANPLVGFTNYLNQLIERQSIASN